MGTVDLTKSKLDIYNVRDLSIDFIKKAYELTDYADNNPWEYDSVERYLTHGYFLKLAKCKSPNGKKHCNLTLLHINKIGIHIIKSQTYMDKDIDLGIDRLLSMYIKFLKEDNKI